LENAINTYAGTVLYISHDRYFINNTADKLYELKPDKTTLYLGNYDYYTEKTANLQTQAQITQNHDSHNKQVYINQKEQQAKERQRKAKIEKLENSITQTEAAIAAQDETLARPEVATDPIAAAAAYEIKVELEEKLNNLLSQWEEIL
jgi:ATP-binding cassette subfamily F protein 3